MAFIGCGDRWLEDLEPVSFTPDFSHKANFRSVPTGRSVMRALPFCAARHAPISGKLSVITMHARTKGFIMNRIASWKGDDSGLVQEIQSR